MRVALTIALLVGAVACGSSGSSRTSGNSTSQGSTTSTAASVAANQCAGDALRADQPRVTVRSGAGTPQDVAE